ncbi:MAG: Lar family restriction alleviation protein [Thermoguttaceae bacterium]|nr:Lar family restriction alleviation protein [Thermoguttaceae bacterium]
MTTKNEKRYPRISYLDDNASIILKPCPFCGCAATLVRREDPVENGKWTTTYTVECNNDSHDWSHNCFAVTAPAPTIDAAVNMWNNRVEQEHTSSSWLKNCPFCGSEAETISEKNRNTGIVESYIRCSNPNCFIRTYRETDIPLLFQQWNSRER